MSKSKNSQLMQDDVDDLVADLKKMQETGLKYIRESEELLKFKPGELTPEEEEVVKREGFHKGNFISQKMRQEELENLQKYKEKMRKREEVMSRPKTDPERIQLEREERVRKFHQIVASRFDAFGYHIFLIFIGIFAYFILDKYGWNMGIFCFLLMLAILELSYRLYKRH